MLITTRRRLIRLIIRTKLLIIIKFFPGALWARWFQVYEFGSNIVYGQNYHKNPVIELYDLYNYRQSAKRGEFLADNRPNDQRG